MNEALIEALKEAGRVVVLAVIPVLVSQLEKGEWNWRIIAVVGAVALLRFVDKYLHTLGMEVEEATGKDSVLTVGLTRF
jgi:hypothetical protein